MQRNVYTALPVINRLEKIECDTTSDYTNLLVFAGCCKVYFDKKDSTATDMLERAYRLHIDRIRQNTSKTAYRDAMAGIINIAYIWNYVKGYEEGLSWTERMGDLIKEYKTLYAADKDYIDKQWARHKIFSATSLEGVGRHDEAEKADVVINGDNVTLTAFENEHTKHVTLATISSITDKEMILKSDWKVYVDDKLIINEVYDKERYIRINNDFEKEIVGTWEGKVTSSEDEHTDGEVHRWAYKANGTYVYYSKENGEWKADNDVLADYFVDGILLCTRWKKTQDSDELREWWEIESIKNGVMKWTALRMREDDTTYTATFEMTKIQ